MIDYEKKPIFAPEIIKINDKTFIQTQLYSFRGNKMYMVSLVKDNAEKVLGVFDEKDSQFKVAYNDNKILIYYEEFNYEKNCMGVSEVAMLYNVADDMTYACSNVDAIILFNGNLKPDDLMSPSESSINRDRIRKRI